MATTTCSIFGTSAGWRRRRPSSALTSTTQRSRPWRGVRGRRICWLRAAALQLVKSLHILCVGQPLGVRHVHAPPVAPCRHGRPHDPFLEHQHRDLPQRRRYTLAGEGRDPPLPAPSLTTRIRGWCRASGCVLCADRSLRWQVCALQWSVHDKEIVSSHGFSQPPLALQGPSPPRPAGRAAGGAPLSPEAGPLCRVHFFHRS